MTLEIAKSEELQQLALSIPDRARAIIITSAETYQQAGNVLLVIKDLKKQIDNTFDPIIQKANLAHKEAVAQKKKVAGPLDEAEQIIKPKIGTYVAEEERKRRLEEERLQQEARARAEAEAVERAAAAEKNGDKQEAEALLNEGFDVPTVVVPKTTPKVEGISTRMMWKYRIKDQRQIKSEYLMPDEKKIGAIVRAMGKEATSLVGGIEVYAESVVAAGRRMAM